MCAQFLLKTSTNELQDLFHAEVPEPLKGKTYDAHVVPFYRAPVIVAENGQTLVKEMRFHLTPHWSKTEKVKWATYNARLESIEQKASFRDAFKKHHCLVPISCFIEAIYEGEYAGYMVRFQQEEGRLMAAAGIFDEWIHPETGEVIESFSIITDDPDPFIEDVGHDRQPVFIEKSFYHEWLQPALHNPLQWKQELKQHKECLDFSVERFRAMKPGWEKRK